MVDALDRFERAAMAYERLGKLTKDDEKTREIRKAAIAELADARRAVLEASRPAQPAVKKLEWYAPVSAFTVKCADTAFGIYRTRMSRSGWAWELPIAGDYTWGEADSEAAVQAAAQADYDRRVTSCLVTPAAPSEGER